MNHPDATAQATRGEQERPHALYRFYANDGALLYVGITLEPHQSREAALEAERAAIIAEQPRYNIVHNRGTRPTRPRSAQNDDGLMLALAGADPDTGPWGTHAEHMPDDCHDHCVPTGRLAIYFPYRWRSDGCAYYQCSEGHRWTCWWGHEQAGDAPQWRSAPAEVLRS